MHFFTIKNESTVKQKQRKKTRRTNPDVSSHSVLTHSPPRLCQVRYLKIIEKSGYQALPWVRYITQNGGRSTVHRVPLG